MYLSALLPLASTMNS